MIRCTKLGIEPSPMCYEICVLASRCDAAKEILQGSRITSFIPNGTARVKEALNMAIEALSAEAETDGDMGEVSDGYHTFNQLYHQRAVLFAAIVKLNKEKAWKSWKHGDGEFCFDSNKEWFIVGVDTPEGSYTYHYEKKYWDMFDCVELERGKFWDGHTEEDVTRLLSLPSAEAEWTLCSNGLPKAEYGESDCVLTTCCWKSDTQNRWIEKLYFNGGNWCYPTGEYYTQKVLAWKPLPEPYREDGEA